MVWRRSPRNLCHTGSMTRNRSRIWAGAAGAAALLCALLAGLVRLHITPLPPDGLSMAMPIAPGRALMLTFWTHDLAFSHAFTTAGLTRQRPGPLRLTLALRTPARHGQERLAVWRVPAWPLASAALLFVAAGCGLWKRSAPGRAGKLLKEVHDCTTRPR